MKHLIWLLLALALVLTACPDPPSTTLTINTPNSQVMISDSVVFTVSDATGKTINNTDVQWISTDPKIVTINANGVATGLTVGSTTISASRGKNKSTLFKLSVAQIKKGVVNVFSPTLQNPGRVLSLPVVQYQDYALYQQDIAFPLENTGASLQTRGNVMASFNGIFVKRLPWANRTLPYYLNPSLPQEIKNLVSQTAVLYKQRADINLVQLSSEPSTFIDHVYIDLTMKPNICGDSMVGRKGGRQVIHFALGCQLHSYIHEFGHALGLWHEQTRSDRNNFITIKYPNIINNLQDQFDITDTDDGYPNGAYDYASVMHYSVYSGASKKDSKGDALPTFELVNPKAYTADDIGKNDNLSTGDILALNTLYNLPVIDLKLSIGGVTNPNLLSGGSSGFSVYLNNKGPKNLGTHYLVLKSIAPATITYTGGKYNCQSVLINYLSCALNGNQPPNTNVVLSGFRVSIPENYTKNSIDVTAVLNPDNLIPLNETDLQATKTFPVTILSPDNYEMNNDFIRATNISNGFDSGLINLHIPTDQDFFMFEAPNANNKDIAYNFSVEAPLDTSTPLELELYDNNQQLVKAGTTGSAGDTSVLISKPTSPGQHYYVLVKGAGKTRYYASFNQVSLKIPPNLNTLISTLLFLAPSSPVELTLIKASDFFDVNLISDPAAPPAVVQLNGDNLILALLDLNGNQIAQGITSEPGIQSLSLPAGVTGQEYVVQISRAQNNVVLGDITVNQPTTAYRLELK